MNRSEKITVEVAYALPERQHILVVELEPGCTALEAVQRSGIGELYPDLDIMATPMGIFSRPLDGKTLARPDAYQMQPGDRVELYRPLQRDPKEARRELAERAKLRREQRRTAKAPDVSEG